jgi:hypothetical protein
LIEALDLLRTGENNDNAYSRHEAALSAIPGLIRSRPDDLPDVAVSLALQLLRSENKFNMTEFESKRDAGMGALLVEEPVSVGQALIEELFGDGGLADRLVILGALQVAACELSGYSRPAELQVLTKTDPLSLKQGDRSKLLEIGSRVLSKTRWKRSRPIQRAIQNRFAPIAPTWFYLMVAGFFRQKENDALWTGPTGSIFLTYLFRCLSTIVEVSGVQASQVLAGDLFDLVWGFRYADVAEIRLSVLVAVATSVAVLPEEKIFMLLLREDSSLPKDIADMSSRDPNEECRSLSKSISQTMFELVRNNSS